MMNEQWIKWKPIPDLEGQCSLEQLCDSIHGFEIILINSKYTKKIKLLWKDWVQSFSKIQGPLVVETKIFLDQKYGPDFHADWSFFIVEDSVYLKKLSKESGALSDAYDVVHFVLITPDSMVNIIPTHEPEVMWL